MPSTRCSPTPNAGRGAPALAYRAFRPLLGWLVGLTSFGSSERAAWRLLVWTAVGIGLVAAGAAELAGRWGRTPDWVPLLVIPGVAGQLLFPGLSDGVATGRTRRCCIR